MGCTNSRTENPEGQNRQIPIPITFDPKMTELLPPGYQQTIYYVFKYFVDTYPNVSTYRFEVHICDGQMSRPADIATQKCVVDLICLALKLQGAKVTVQFMSYSNPASMDDESAIALGLIDDMLSCASFTDLRNLWTDRKGELRDKHNERGLQGASRRGGLEDNEDDEIVSLINKAIAEGTQSKSKGVNSETIVANIRQVLYLARYRYHKGWNLDDYMMNRDGLWKDTQRHKSQDEAFVLPARFKSLFAGATQSFQAAAETAAVPTEHIVLVPEAITQSAMSNIKLAARSVVIPIKEYNRLHDTNGTRQDLFGISVVPIGGELGQPSKWQGMDDLLSGELDFLDCTPVSHKIRTNGPGYDLLPKIILGAVDKSLDRGKKLRLYGDELCMIPSEKDMKSFLEFAGGERDDLQISRAL